MSPLNLQVMDFFEILNNTSEQRLKYRELCAMLLNSETKAGEIVKCLTFLRDNIFLLDKEKEHFVGTLLNVNWIERNEEVQILYEEVILNLVSAHTCYLPSVLRMIVLKFYAGKNAVEKSFITSEDAEVFKKLHSLLKRIIKLVPLSPQVLMSMLATNYPYIRKCSYIHLCYVENILKISEYLPEERRNLLQLIVSNMLDIDVHCPKSDIEDAELEENSMFPMEVDREESEENVRMRHPLANTLDILMERLFTFIDNVCKRKDSCLDWEATKKLYKEFLLLFERLILPTHACAHVQFVMFYICSFKQPLYEGFIDYLWKKVQNVNLPSVIRQACACYIGSFLARASYVSINGLRDILTIMTNWIHKYIDSQCENAQCITDAVIHGTFYTVCQTVFYVFVFHHKELIETENGLKYVRKLNFERIVNCRLNPLKTCLSSVVANFANITKTYQIVYCYTIVERNNRRIIPVVAHASGISQSINVTRLDIYFPFDPYVLKISGERIQNLYRIYKQPSEEENEMKDEEFVPESSPSSATMSDGLSFGTATYLGSAILKDR
ncbi:RNA polymerase I-specific transcription initiation factor RRN3 [Centruroides vittatus]|uniref:RNA polymerase I-specific transcription initiation factor RRN3 n=1 Tax=Centruroides vittatus TaxID=120091 RepID=UPI00350F679D